MKLIAGLIVRNEMDRYLRPCIAHLLEFCDEIRVLDDHSTDDTYYWLGGLHEPVFVRPHRGGTFYDHEGQARNALLAYVAQGEPTHILAIDADEFVSDGPEMRRELEKDPERAVWSLAMEEVWKADETALWIRQDGGWRPHGIPILWRAQPATSRAWWEVADKPLACGREPVGVRKLWRSAKPTGAAILHFGWTNPDARQKRYDRYAEHDQGRFHQGSHLRSILWPDAKVNMQGRMWPPALQAWKGDLLEHLATPA